MSGILVPHISWASGAEHVTILAVRPAGSVFKLVSDTAIHSLVVDASYVFQIVGG
jgi:hypothetical protein